MSLAWPAFYTRHVYLSPHPDDVILSCGGLIWQQAQRGESVAVVTVFGASPPPGETLSPFARSLHDRWQRSAQAGVDFSDPPAVRRAEDVQAFEALSDSVQVVHLPLLDCIYRMHPLTGEALYASEEGIFGLAHPSDPAWEALSEAPLLPDGATLYVSLAVGHHIDHQLLRVAVEGWGLPADRLRYYEDYPYVTKPGALEAALGKREGWAPLVVPMPEAALQAKIVAAAQHNSQISTFWPNLEQMAAALHVQAGRTGGERFWVRLTEVEGTRQGPA
jgi:LmbE family N-acetylglucosaminyl deacetylase